MRHFYSYVSNAAGKNFANTCILMHIFRFVSIRLVSVYSLHLIMQASHPETTRHCLRRPLAWWGMLVCCLLLVPWKAIAGPVVSLERSTDGLWLQGLVQWHQDLTGQLSLPDVLAKGEALGWETPDDPLRAQGAHPWWMKITLQQTQVSGPWLLALPTTAIRDITFHGPYDSQGRALATGLSTGLTHPYSSRPMGMERIVFPLGIEAPGTYTVYIRVQNDIPQNVTPSLWVLSDYVENRQHKRLFDGIIYGVLLTLLVYNLTLAGVFRDVAYLYYVLTCAAALLTIATFNGHTARYLWPEHPWWIEHTYVIWPSLWVAFSGLFARAFLSIRAASSQADGVILAIVAMAFTSALAGALGQTVLAQRANEWLAVVGVVVITLMALWIWRRGYTPAAWYLLAQLTLFLSVVGVVWVSWGWWNAPFMLANGLQIGIMVEMVVFAVALSVRIRGVQQEKTVLSQQAHHMTQAAMSDALTGLLNRRGLTASASELLRKPGQHALILLDLDRFKPINDAHGHEVGDLVLNQMARRLEQHCRESDLAARLGGDEFVVVIGQCPDRATLEKMVKRLCEALEAPISWQDDTFQVSASAGVALAPTHASDLKTLLRLADQAMYQAKKSNIRMAFATAGETGILASH